MASDSKVARKVRQDKVQCVGTTGRDVDMLFQAVEVTDIFCKFTSLNGLDRHEPCCIMNVKIPGKENMSAKSPGMIQCFFYIS